MRQLSRQSKHFFLFILTGCMFFFITEIIYAQDQKIKFAVIADHKKDYVGLEKALTFINEQEIDFLIVAGDFFPLRQAYTNYYSLRGFEISRENPPEMQNVYFVLGNHDRVPYGEIFFQEHIAPYYPENGPQNAPCGTIFSFNRGNAHFVVTNQYWNYEEGGYTNEQLNWIEKDLQASQQLFKFVIGHEPAFPIDRHVGNSLDLNPIMRDKFWKILADNGVQAFFCGHTHHLSVVKSQGVYQIDTGEVASDHLAITIFEINGPSAVARLYETKGSIPNDTIFNSSLGGSNSGDIAYSVVFNSGIGEENDNSLGCFIRTLAP